MNKAHEYENFPLDGLGIYARMRFFYLKFQQPEKMMQLVRNNQLHKHLTNIDAEARLIARELANECAVEKNIHFEYMLEKRKQLEDEICRTLIFI